MAPINFITDDKHKERLVMRLEGVRRTKESNYEGISLNTNQLSYLFDTNQVQKAILYRSTQDQDDLIIYIDGEKYEGIQSFIHLDIFRFHELPDISFSVGNADTQNARNDLFKKLCRGKKEIAVLDSFRLNTTKKIHEGQFEAPNIVVYERCPMNVLWCKLKYPKIPITVTVKCEEINSTTDMSNYEAVYLDYMCTAGKAQWPIFSNKLQALMITLSTRGFSAKKIDEFFDELPVHHMCLHSVAIPGKGVKTFIFEAIVDLTETETEDAEIEDDATEDVEPAIEDGATETETEDAEIEDEDEAESVFSAETEEAEPAIEDDANEVVEPAIENDANEVVEPAIENDANEVVEPAIENDANEVVEPAIKNDANEVVEPAIEDDATEDAEIPPAVEDDVARQLFFTRKRKLDDMTAEGHFDQENYKMHLLKIETAFLMS